MGFGNRRAGYWRGGVVDVEGNNKKERRKMEREREREREREKEGKRRENEGEGMKERVKRGCDTQVDSRMNYSCDLITINQ